MISCNCGASSRDTIGWTAVPGCSNGAVHHLCPSCSGRAHYLAKELVGLLGTSNAHLYSLYDGASFLHDPSGAPLPPVAPEIEQAVRAMSGEPELTDISSAQIIVNVHRFECGCGGCSTWCFGFEGRPGGGWPYKVSPEDVGMRLHDGDRIRITFDRLPEET